ncbi:MAG TPA: NAD(P)H-hydrate dehydratase [Longimicrobiales bacterium]
MKERDIYGRETVAVWTAAEAAALDREARERHGVPERVLMEDAGRSAALVLDRLYPRGRVVAAVGSGHNGGDALVMLRTLRAWGRDVACVAVGSRAPDPALAHGHPIPILPFEEMAAAFAGAEVLVDGILGTGTSGAPRGRAAEAIRALHASGRPVVALDLPSGVDATTGHVPGDVVSAAVTITFGWPKLGLLLEPGRSACGRIIAVEIGFPPFGADAVDGPVPPARLLTPAWAAARLPRRGPAAHKGSVGRVLVAGGGHGMAGAAVTAARAALRAGAGYVRLAAPEINRAVFQTRVPEAVYADADDAAAVRAAAGAVDAIVLGPGLGRGDDARRRLDLVIDASHGRPTLLDADALTLLAEAPDRLRELARERPLLLTPHPGEMRALSGRAVDDIVAAPVDAARALAGTLGCAVLLKGAPSIVAAPGEPAWIATQHSSDLATAGMGDQLAGAAAAFLAAGAPPAEAAGLALFYCGRAAVLAGRGRSLVPDDVTEHLDRAFADPGPAEPPLGLPFITFDQPPRW